MLRLNQNEWKLLKILGIAILGIIFVFKILGSYHPVDLTVTLQDANYRGDQSSLEILNTGSKAVQITKITINDRADCKVNTMNQEFDRLGRLGSGLPAQDTGFSSSSLKIGDKLNYVSSCQVVRATVETDQGSETYSFSGN